MPSSRTSAGSAPTGATGSSTPPTTSSSMYEWAIELINKGKAYVCDLTADQVSEYRGTLTQPGKDSPYRNRRVEENLDLFERMQQGRIPRRLRDAPRQDRYGPPEPQHARPGHVSHPARRTITARATSGASTRCTTGRTASRTPSRASRTRSARWNSRTTARCTTGSSTRSTRAGPTTARGPGARRSTIRSRSNSPG